MINFIFYFIIFFILLLFNNNSYDYDYNFFIYNFFIFQFIFIILLNFLFNSEKKSKLDLDLMFKFLILIFKTPNFLANYLMNILKKIYIFLVYFKYRHIYNSFFIFSRKYLNNIFLIWRPLFKKTSYFGYYRANRSKWIK